MQNKVYKLCFYMLLTTMAFRSFAQKRKDLTSEAMQLAILNDTIYVDKSDPRASIKFSFKNTSYITLIAYGINEKILTPPFPIRKIICDKQKVNTLLAGFIYNSEDKLQTSIHYYINDGTPKTKERLDSLMKVGKVEFRKNTRILKQFEIISFDKEVNFSEYRLEKGLYNFELIYSSGEKITNYVDASQIKRDKKNSCANVFQGCVISRKIPLKVY